MKKLDCFPGSCSSLNLSSCVEMEVEQAKNFSVDKVNIDVEGCFSTDELRISKGYYYYTQVIFDGSIFENSS